MARRLPTYARAYAYACELLLVVYLMIVQSQSQELAREISEVKIDGNIFNVSNSTDLDSNVTNCTEFADDVFFSYSCPTEDVEVNASNCNYAEQNCTRFPIPPYPFFCPQNNCPDWFCPVGIPSQVSEGNSSILPLESRSHVLVAKPDLQNLPFVVNGYFSAALMNISGNLTLECKGTFVPIETTISKNEFPTCPANTSMSLIKLIPNQNHFGENGSKTEIEEEIEALVIKTAPGQSFRRVKFALESLSSQLSEPFLMNAQAFDCNATPTHFQYLTVYSPMVNATLSNCTMNSSTVGNCTLNNSSSLLKHSLLGSNLTLAKNAAFVENSQKNSNYGYGNGDVVAFGPATICQMYIYVLPNSIFEQTLSILNHIIVEACLYDDCSECERAPGPCNDLNAFDGSKTDKLLGISEIRNVRINTHDRGFAIVHEKLGGFYPEPDFIELKFETPMESVSLHVAGGLETALTVREMFCSSGNFSHHPKTYALPIVGPINISNNAYNEGSGARDLCGVRISVQDIRQNATEAFIKRIVLSSKVYDFDENTGESLVVPWCVASPIMPTIAPTSNVTISPTLTVETMPPSLAPIDIPKLERSSTIGLYIVIGFGLLGIVMVSYAVFEGLAKNDKRNQQLRASTRKNTERNFYPKRGSYWYSVNLA